MQYLTIIVYHYVRDLENTRYPLIKGLSISKFKGQLDYIQKHYQVVTADEVADFYLNRKPLPSNPCLLTFDDGLIDHFTNVFPILNERGISGIFFPVAKSILEKCVLDVHKIHFILASVGDYKLPNLLNRIFSLIDNYRNSFKIPSRQKLLIQYQKSSQYKWDRPEISFVKGILQYGLSELINDDIRKKIMDILFQEYVEIPENILAQELYMNIQQLKTMVKNEMTIGGHSYSHPWLDKMAETAVRQEIKQMIDFLKKVYPPLPSRLFFVPPYNSKNNNFLKILREFGFEIGFTNDIGLATLNDNSLLLPRLDTNHLPFSRDAEKFQWTKMALEE